MVLRSYQEEGVLKALAGNTIVMLPTGAGKTLVAAETILRIHPQARALFLVPTIMLVEQQAKAVREWTGRRVGEYKGGATLPASFDVLVSTPKAFQQAQSQHPQLSWSSFHLVVFDEVHHVLKEHPYRQLAMSLRLDQHPARILGLTASLTYAVTEQLVRQKIDSICYELNISHIATATPEQLQAAGYHAKATPAEVIQIPQSEQAPGSSSSSGGGSGVLPKSQRQPHLMAQTFFKRVAKGEAADFALLLMGCIRAMEEAVAAAARYFVSPLERLTLRDWSKYCLDHSKGCSEREQPRLVQLGQWYEALKLLVVSWEEAEDAAVTLLRMDMPGTSLPAGGAGQLVWPAAVQAAVGEFWASVRPSYLRMEHLKAVLRDKVESSDDFRGILFVEQRVMTHVLEAVIAQDPLLSRRLRTACLYASSTPATASLRVTPTQAKERLADFSCGAVNLLITTVVAEEGMDVPAANCVIRFDPIMNAVSFVQGRGRARQADSSFVVLSEREDRTAALLERVEQQQGRIALSYQPQETMREQEVKARAQQASREQGAWPLLAQYQEAGAGMETLNMYVQRTRALLTDSWEEGGTATGPKMCVLRYTSALRDVVAQGEAPNKKLAKQAAAGVMIQKLKAGATC